MPAVGGGVGGAVGIAAETTYGTWVASTTWIEVHSAKFQEKPHLVQGTGLAYGRQVDLNSRFVNTYFDASGDIEMEVLTTKFALLLANIMGSSATLTELSTTTAYQLSTVLGFPDNQNFLSIQSIVPRVDTTTAQQNLHGCKITKAEFSAERAGLLMVTLSIDSQYLETVNTAGTPSYSTSSYPFNGQSMTVAVGTFGSEVALDGVKKITVTLERTLKDDRIYVGDQFKEEPVTTGMSKISGQFDLDLLNASQYNQLANLMHTQAAVSVLVTFTGPAIGSSGYNHTLLLNVTNARITSGATPELDGPEVVTATISFEGKTDAANDAALRAVLTTADTTF